MAVSVTDTPKVGGTTWASGDAPGNTQTTNISAAGVGMPTTAPTYAGAQSNARPLSLATMDVDTGLTLEAIERKLQIEATLDDVFVDVGADVVFTGKKIMLPDAAVMRLKSMTKGEYSQTIPLMQPLAGPGRGGITEGQQGYERALTLKYMKVYYNEYSQAVAGEKWGVNANSVQVFDLYGQIQPALSKWFKEDTGRQYREALLQTYSWVLTKAGTALEQEFNSNWFIPNTAIGSQVAYNSDKNVYFDNLKTALGAADTGAGTAGENANISLDYLVALDYYAQNVKRINPITVGGKATYIFMVPSPQYKKLVSTGATGQLGNLWQSVTQLTAEEQNFPGVAGRVMSLLICEDQRSPTITFSAYDGAGTATIEYVEPGNDDGRNKTLYNTGSNLAWDVGFLIGANGIVDWEVTPLHFEMEQTEYGKKYGKGAFAERGIQLGRFVDDSGVYANFGSIVCPFTTTSLITVK